MAKTGYPLPRWSQGAIVLADAHPDSTLAEFETGPPDSGYSPPHRLTDLNHTYPIMSGLFDQQPTRARVIASPRNAAGHFCARRGRACGKSLTLLYSLYVMCLSLTRVTKSYLLALGTTQISSYFIRHRIGFLNRRTEIYPVTCFVSKLSRITLVELSCGAFFSEPFVHTHTLRS